MGTPGGVTEAVKGGEFSGRREPEKGSEIGVSAAIHGAAVEIAITCLEKASQRVIAIIRTGLLRTEIIKTGKGACGCYFEYGAAAVYRT